jgi:HEAT repeat protein
VSINVTSAPPQPISLCFVYAPKDVLLKQELENHLSPLVRRGLVSLWSVDEIVPGDNPVGEIEHHVDTAQIILLLISANFFASENCDKAMMHSLLMQKKEHVHVIPVILRPVDWKASPIGTLRVLPAKGKPVTKWRDHNDAFWQIAEAIQEIILRLLNPTDKGALPENTLQYLNWLVKRTSSLETRGISLEHLPFQGKLEELYIALNARYSEKDVQRQGSPFSLHALQAETSEQTPALPLSDVVARHDHLLLLGEPGSGKTTFLRYLALKHAQAFREQRDTEFGKAYFPIYLRIADYVEHGMKQGKSLSKYLASDCRRHECPVLDLADVLNTNLQTGSCLVLLDGLDEVVNADDHQKVVQQLEDFVRCYEDFPNRFIITSRHAGYREAPLGDTFVHYILQKMEETHIGQFLDAWCLAVETASSSTETGTIQTKRAPYEVESLKRAIQTVPGIHRLATNPLFLHILAQLHRTGAPLPQGRVALYNQVTKTLIETWRTSKGLPLRLDQSSIPPLLSALAYWLHLKKPGGFVSEREIYRELGKEWMHLTKRRWREEDPRIEEYVKQFLRTIRDHTGILAEDAPHQYGFAHLTFEEYYAAHYLNLITNSQKRAQYIRTHLHDPRWQEPILLALGLIGIKSPDEARILIETAILAEGEEARANALAPAAYESLLGRDYFFALRCMGDDIPIDATRAEQFIERLICEITQQAGSGRFQKYQEALSESLKYVETSTYASMMLPHLIKNRKGHDYSIRIWSLYSLGRISRVSASEKIRPYLFEMLCDEDIWIRSAALWGLSHMPGSEITRMLLNVLNADADALVRKYAAKYLGERRESSPLITKALLDVLHNSDILLRDAAVESLGQLGNASPEVISSLIALLNREILLLTDESVMQSLRQLSQSSPDVVPMMANALQSAAPRVRLAVAQAIETFGYTSPEAMAILCDVPQQRASIRAPQVPFCIRQWYWLPHQIEALCLYKLHAPYASTRWEAVKTLGQLEELSERAESALLTAIFDENTLVRSQAVQSLNIFEMSSEVLSVFINVLFNDSEASVRAHIVECFGEIDQPSEDIVQALLKAIRDPEDYVRTRTVESLGHKATTSPEILAALLFVLLNDDSFGPRREVVTGFINRKDLPAKAISAIVHALSYDNHASVRKDCALLLGQEGSDDQTITQALLKGLSDTDRHVRKACSQALVQLGQRFLESRETITVQLVPLIQEQQNDMIGYCSPCDVAYDALWLLVNDGSIEPLHL